MAEHPILFSAPMVRAILEGRKTQTRRIVKPQPEAVLGGHLLPLKPSCPFGYIGDRLWVRETWGYRVGCGVNPTTEAVIEYRADSTRATLPVPAGESGLPRQRPNMTDAELLAWWESWRPSIHMPRWASRITLEVTGVRVERLNVISARDALAEGIEHGDWADIQHDVAHGISVVDQFRQLWESINGAGSWDANPRVWVVEFRRVEVARG